MKPYLKFAKWFCSLLGLIFLSVISFKVYFAIKNLPSLESLKHYEPLQSTRVFDKYGELIGNFFDERRTVISVKRLPKYVKLSFVAAEDADFYMHGGIDVNGLARAIFTEIKYRLIGGRRVGGSTITQQTARGMLLSSHQTYIRKLQEIILALRIEDSLSKDEILHLYLNQIYFGNGAYGIEEASRTYFNKSAIDLTLNEAAALASIPKSPNRINPFADLERLELRKKYVLKQMHKHGFITTAQKQYALEASLVKSIEERTKNYNAPYFLRAVKKDLSNHPNFIDTYNNGLTVYSTLDLGMQKAAEKVLVKGLKKLDKRFKQNDGKKVNGGLVALDVETGGVLALVGGRDFKTSPFNRITQAKRQIGSALKPLIYSLAIDKKLVTAATVITDTPKAFYDPGTKEFWQPRNHTRSYLGDITLRRCLVSSVNTCTVTLLEKIGLKTFLDFAHEINLNTKETPFKRNLTISLGSSEAIPINFANAFRLLANEGKYSDYHLVDMVKYENDWSDVYKIQKEKQVISKEAAFIITNILKNVISEKRREEYLPKVLAEIAGKSGTTNDARSLWFVGYSPKILALIYVGFDDNRSIGQNAWAISTAFPIWAEFMNSLDINHYTLSFKEPEELLWRYVDQKSKEFIKKSKSTKAHVVKEGFLPGTIDEDLGKEDAVEIYGGSSLPQAFRP